MSTLEVAIALATKAHAGQTDKAGSPYIEHPLRVMRNVRGEPQQIAAALHDVVEDTPYTFDDLRRAGFSEKILGAVDALTKRAGEDYFAFVRRAAENDIARPVKLADITDNMDLSRIASPTRKDFARIERYRRAQALIEAIGRGQSQHQLLPLNADEAEPARKPVPKRDAAMRALDELFTVARQYRSSRDYIGLLRFVARFRSYSPFNAMLVHVQMPGATFVAPPRRWSRDYKRRIKEEARPLVILQPMGPVMFVFDVNETEPEEGAPQLPPEVLHPFAASQGCLYGEMELTIDNARRDGIHVGWQKSGSQAAGSIRTVAAGLTEKFQVRSRPQPEFIHVPRRYAIVLNSDHDKETAYATLVHELAHLYCGHLGTPNEKWWPERPWLPREEKEFEAESVSYLVCKRLGIDSPSASYLGQYLHATAEIPGISLDCVLTAAGLIEQMGRARMKPRGENRGR